MVFSFQINAMANRAAGKGYENENFYANIKFQFLGIENIHVMRSSLQKLIEGLYQIIYLSLENIISYSVHHIVKTKINIIFRKILTSPHPQL